DPGHHPDHALLGRPRPVEHGLPGERLALVLRDDPARRTEAPDLRAPTEEVEPVSPGHPLADQAAHLRPESPGDPGPAPLIEHEGEFGIDDHGPLFFEVDGFAVVVVEVLARRLPARHLDRIDPGLVAEEPQQLPGPTDVVALDRDDADVRAQSGTPALVVS